MYHVFVNPASRSGSGSDTWKEAKRIFDEKNIPYTVHFTKKAQSIQSEYTKILSSTEERPVKIIVLGGDGTLNQCIEGISDIENTELSLIRNGSGNDFSRNKNLPDNMEEIIDGIINRKHILGIDVGLVSYSDGCLPDGSKVPDGSHRFLVSSGFGYDADICYYANRSKFKKLLKNFIYVFYGVKNVFTTGLANVSLQIDSNTPRNLSRVYFISSMNQPVEGGGLPMVPNAVDTDGKLGFCIIHSMKRLGALTCIPLIYKETHMKRKGVEILEGTSVSIVSDTPKMVHYDGETPGMYKKVKVEIIGKIKFIY